MPCWTLKPARFRAWVAEETGSGLMEVLFSAVVVVVIGLATLGLLDASSKTAARSEAKGIGSSLAQQDQQRMRSMPVPALHNLAETQSVPVNGIDYQVKSQSDYVNEGGAPPACGRADFIRLRTTVSAPAMANTRPVEIESLVHARDSVRGCMTVAVTNARNQPVVGLRVRIVSSLSGTNSFEERTNAEGKAIFGWVPASPYTISFPDPGWVDKDGASNPTINGSVKAGATASYPQTLDRPARIDATFATRYTKLPQTGTPGGLGQWDDLGERVSVEHSKLQSGARRTPADGAPTPPTAIIPVDSLFPFEEPYAIYSGSCNKLPDPMVASLAALNPRNFATSVVTLPSTTHPVKVFEPALDVRVTTGSGSALVALKDARVFFRSANPACPEVRPVQLTNASGQVPYPGLPYSSAGYAICVERLGTASTPTRRFRVPGAPLNDGVNGRQVDVSFSSTSVRDGTCP